MDSKRLSDEEKIMVDVMIAARKIQEFLWSDLNKDAGIEEFRRMLRKRLAKIDKLDVSNPYFKIELKKRLLQMACVCVNLIFQLDNREMQEKADVISNLSEYDAKVEEQGD